MTGATVDGEGWFVPSPDPSLHDRYEDSPASPALRRSLEMSARLRRGNPRLN